MDGGVAAGICVSVVIVVVIAITGAVWFYRKGSIWRFFKKDHILQTEEKVNLKKKSKSKSRDHLLRDQQTIDMTDCDLLLYGDSRIKQSRPRGHMFGGNNLRAFHDRLRNMEMPKSYHKHTNENKHRQQTGQQNRIASEYSRKRSHKHAGGSSEKIDVRKHVKRLENGFKDNGKARRSSDRKDVDVHKFKKRVDTDYKGQGEPKQSLERNSQEINALYRDKEGSSHVLKPLKKHLTKIRPPARRPSIHSRRNSAKSLESIRLCEDNAAFLRKPRICSLKQAADTRFSKKSDDISHTEITVYGDSEHFNENRFIKRDRNITRKSVKEIVDDIKGLTDHKRTRHTKTIKLTDEQFDSIKASQLIEKYNKEYISPERPIVHNFNTSGKSKRWENEHENYVDNTKQRPSYVASESIQGKQKDVHLKQGSEHNNETTHKNERFQQSECSSFEETKTPSFYKGVSYRRRQIESRVNSDTTMRKESETRTVTSQVSKARSDIRPFIPNDNSTASFSKQSPFCRSSKADDTKLSDIKRSVYKTTLQIARAKFAPQDETPKDTVKSETYYQRSHYNPILPDIGTSQLSREYTAINDYNQQPHHFEDAKDSSNQQSVNNIVAFQQKPRNCSLTQAAVTSSLLKSSDIQRQTSDHAKPTVVSPEDRNTQLPSSNSLIVSPVKVAPPVAPKPFGSKRSDLPQQIQNQSQNESQYVPRSILKADTCSIISPPAQDEKQSFHQVQTAVDNPPDKPDSSSLKTLNVSPVKVGPPVAPKPPRRRKPRISPINQVSDQSQDNGLHRSTDFQNFEADPKNFRNTKIQTPDQTKLSGYLQPLQSTQYHQSAGPKYIPNLTGVSVRWSKNQTQIENRFPVVNGDIVLTNTGSGINGPDLTSMDHKNTIQKHVRLGSLSLNADMNNPGRTSMDHTQTKQNHAQLGSPCLSTDMKSPERTAMHHTETKQKHVQFGSPVQCQYAVRTPSSESTTLSSPPSDHVINSPTNESGSEDNIHTDKPPPAPDNHLPEPLAQSHTDKEEGVDSIDENCDIPNQSNIVAFQQQARIYSFEQAVDTRFVLKNSDNLAEMKICPADGGESENNMYECVDETLPLPPPPIDWTSKDTSHLLSESSASTPAHTSEHSNVRQEPTSSQNEENIHESFQYDRQHEQSANEAENVEISDNINTVNEFPGNGNIGEQEHNGVDKRSVMTNGLVECKSGEFDEPHKHSKGISNTSVTEFNPNLCSTPLHSETGLVKIEHQAGLEEEISILNSEKGLVKNDNQADLTEEETPSNSEAGICNKESDLEKGEYTLIQEALAKRRKRFQNHSMDLQTDSTENMDKSSFWHDDTCIYTADDTSLNSDTGLVKNDNHADLGEEIMPLNSGTGSVICNEESDLDKGE